MAYQTIEVNTEAFITTITLNRPQRLNALTLTLADELHEALHSHDQEQRCRYEYVVKLHRVPLQCLGQDDHLGHGNLQCLEVRAHM